jgi:ABC-2 type transport system permease protein
MIAIAGRDFRALWRTPAGWLLCGGSVFLLAWWFLLLVELYRRDHQPRLVSLQSDLGASDLILAPYVGGTPMIALLLIVVSALATRQIADERRTGTLELLLCSPRSAIAIVAGKYLGALGFLGLLLLLWLLIPGTLAFMTPLDWGRLVAAGIGLGLAAATLLAIALLASTVSEQPGVAGVLTFVCGLLLLLIGGSAGAGPLQWLALPGHLQGFLTGVVRAADVGYFLALTGTALALAAWRLHGMRTA